MGAQPSRQSPENVGDWDAVDVTWFFGRHGVRLQRADGPQLVEWHKHGILEEMSAPQSCGLSRKGSRHRKACEELQQKLAGQPSTGSDVAASTTVLATVSTECSSKVGATSESPDDKIGSEMRWETCQHKQSLKDLEAGSGLGNEEKQSSDLLQNAESCEVQQSPTGGAAAVLAKVESSVGELSVQQDDPPLQSFHSTPLSESATCEAMAAAQQLREQAKKTFLKAGSTSKLGMVMAQIKQREAVSSMELFRQQAEEMLAQSSFAARDIDGTVKETNQGVDNVRCQTAETVASSIDVVDVSGVVDEGKFVKECEPSVASSEQRQDEVESSRDSSPLTPTSFRVDPEVVLHGLTPVGFSVDARTSCTDLSPANLHRRFSMDSLTSSQPGASPNHKQNLSLLDID